MDPEKRPSRVFVLRSRKDISNSISVIPVRRERDRWTKKVHWMSFPGEMPRSILRFRCQNERTTVSNQIAGMAIFATQKGKKSTSKLLYLTVFLVII